uniref:Uncharacterized protein n=1 Tax=Oryza barthii TaxID=65489 RepID=A0A0D3F4C5_9ORYZ
MEKKVRMRVVLVVLVPVMLSSSLQEAYAGRSRSPGTSGLSKGLSRSPGTSGLPKVVMGCNILGKCDAGDKTGLAKVFNFNFGHG